MTDSRLIFIENLLNDLLNQKELEDYHPDISTALSFLASIETSSRQKFSQDQMKQFKVRWPDDPD
jgi:hypothetical protein